MARRHRFRDSSSAPPERPVAPPAPPLFYRDGRKLSDAERGIAPRDKPSTPPMAMPDDRPHKSTFGAPFDAIILLGALLRMLVDWLTLPRLLGAIVLLALLNGCWRTAG